MLKTIESIISMISFITLTTSWVYIASIITEIFKNIFKIRLCNHNRIIMIILFGLILETLMSIFSIPLSQSFNRVYTNDSSIIIGLRNGAYYTVLLSPISSITGAARGLRRRILK